MKKKTLMINLLLKYSLGFKNMPKGFKLPGLTKLFEVVYF